MRGRDLPKVLSPSAPETDLTDRADELLAEMGWKRTLASFSVDASYVKSLVAQSAKEILDSVEPEYTRFEEIRVRARREFLRMDYLGVFLFFMILAYLVAEPTNIDVLTAIIAAFLVIILVATRWHRRMERIQLCKVILPTARRQWLDALQARALEPFIREKLNAHEQNTRLATRLDSQLMVGLIEKTEPNYFVRTAAMVRLDSTMACMEAGSVGISGPRGVGKSALMSAFCDDRYIPSDRKSELRVLVSAPVDYNARDFILHLFTQLCKTVLEKQPRNESSRRAPMEILAQPRFAVGFPGLLLGLFLMVRAFTGKIPAVDAGRLTVGMAGLVIAGLCLILLVVGRRADQLWSLASPATDHQPLSIADRTRLLMSLQVSGLWNGNV